MDKNLNDFVLHLFEIHLNSCLVININDLYRYIEYCECFGNKTKSSIRNAIMQLDDEHLIEVVPIDDCKIIISKLYSLN